MKTITKHEIDKLVEKAVKNGAQSRYMFDCWKKGEISDAEIIASTSNQYRPQTFEEKEIADFFED